jgi:predicted AlkP superfamily pyrophosphatase or phosphodiesterase
MRLSAFLMGIGLAALAPGRPVLAQAAPPAELEPPTLIVFITVDQLRGDYPDRFGAQLTGGLARLVRGGAHFANAYHDHGLTETAPGHSTTLAGRFPRSTGIVMNSLGVEDPQAPLIGGGGAGASPFRFRGSTLIDWLRVKDPRSRALSVSRKDRGAILPLGRAKQQVYWYASDGRFTTSTYYADTLPTWVQRFNARQLPARMAGRVWTPLLPDSAYPEPDDVPVESGGKNYTFPHVLPSDPAAAARQLPEFPWMDSVTLAFALEGLRELRLGTGPQTDLLAISLSTTDAIGHRFGPDSKELHDQILRLDRLLGAFLDSLFTLRDSSRVVIALTADHGVAPFPEVHAKESASSLRVDLSDLIQATRAKLREKGLDDRAFRVNGPLVTVDREAFARVGLNADSVLGAFAAAAAARPGVLRADLVNALARRDTVKDAIARRWIHMLPPDMQVDLVLTFEPYHMRGNGTSAQHGTPHDYDAHVPVIFYGPPFKPGRYEEFARVVDIAPTLAHVARVRPTEPLDGRVLVSALKQPGLAAGATTRAAAR